MGPMPVPRSCEPQAEDLEARAAQRYRIPDKQRPSRAVADSSKGLASRFYRLKTGALSHRATPPVVDEEPDLRELRVAPAQDAYVS
jgi:hypothetical protein